MIAAATAGPGTRKEVHARAFRRRPCAPARPRELAACHARRLLDGRLRRAGVCRGVSRPRASVGADRAHYGLVRFNRTEGLARARRHRGYQGVPGLIGIPGDSLGERCVPRDASATDPRESGCCSSPMISDLLHRDLRDAGRCRSSALSIVPADADQRHRRRRGLRDPGRDVRANPKGPAGRDAVGLAERAPSDADRVPGGDRGENSGADRRARDI